MADRRIVNASPLILLNRVGSLNLLRRPGHDVFVPEPVAAEIRRRGPDDPTVRAMVASPWLVAVEPPTIPVEIQDWRLGPGESAVLALAAVEPGAEAILDDLQARRCAETLGIAFRGTLGLVLLAKSNGAIPAARPIVEQLRYSGMFLSESVMNRALASVGE